MTNRHRSYSRSVPAALMAALCIAPVTAAASPDLGAWRMATQPILEPFQPYPPQGPPQSRTLLYEPFYIWLAWPVNEGEVLEGSEVKIRWRAGGPISKVRVYYWYEQCRLGGKSRGSVGKLVGGGMVPNTGEYAWTVPWMDTYRLRVRIAGYDAQGGRLATDEIGLFFRPRQLAGLPKTCIAIIKERQRMYYFEGGKVRRMHMVSTAARGYNTPTMRPGSHDRRRGQMGQVFRKSPSPRSRRYDVVMPYWLAITSTGSHGIHATTPRFYSRLGTPASHGCVRQHRADALILYGLVTVGIPVYIF